MQSVTIPLLIPSRCIECKRRVVSNREHRARCADRVTMRDGAAFDIDDVFGKTAPVRRSRAIRSLGRRKTRV